MERDIVRKTVVCWSLMVFGLVGQQASAQSATPALDYEFFKARVQPIFVARRPGHARCVGCHGTGGNLRPALVPLALSVWISSSASAGTLTRHRGWREEHRLGDNWRAAPGIDFLPQSDLRRQPCSLFTHGRTKPDDFPLFELIPAGADR